MDREKQIEEIGKIICDMENGCDGCVWNKARCNERNYAEEIYKAGYRKQSEVVMEIFDDILKIKGLELHDWEAIFELKKKYTDGR